MWRSKLSGGINRWKKLRSHSSGPAIGSGGATGWCMTVIQFQATAEQQKRNALWFSIGQHGCYIQGTPKMAWETKCITPQVRHSGLAASYCLWIRKRCQQGTCSRAQSCMKAARWGLCPLAFKRAWIAQLCFWVNKQGADNAEAPWNHPEPS